MTEPTLKTQRLLLRRLELADAPRVQQLAGVHAVAETTLNIPHPYEDGMAETWINAIAAEILDGTRSTFAITLPREGMIGAIALTINRDFNLAELGYWIGQTYWNQGYATEATIAMLDFGFNQLGLNRIAAQHLTRNPASGRVMEKAGMQREGLARQATRRWGRYEDLALYAILRQNWSHG
ncbi:MAG: GNAT family N-acetyltransferase [Xanthomonadales bacterium]|nr:GNAT family N-acetyltransferase [Xanthomonadales bacterium]